MVTIRDIKVGKRNKNIRQKNSKIGF